MNEKLITTSPSPTPVRAFYCCDPADWALCQALDRHLAPLKQAGRIQTWDEQQILAGAVRTRERDQQFSLAHLLLLLLSPDLLASETGQQQIQMALHRQQTGDAVVMPLLLRPCAWKETELRSLQILPPDHEALMLQPNRDKAWQEVVAEISRVLDALQKRVFVISAPEDQDIVSLTQPRNPYKGLHTFTAQDTHDFFGREALVDELTVTLKDLLVQEQQGKQNARLLALLGASGSGKSSVVLAGLLPRFKQDRVFDSQEWIYLDPIVPGTHPLETLAVSFARQPALGNAVSLHTALESDSLRTLHILALQLAGSPARKVVLFIDQFEEIFTLTTSEEERMHFFDLLVTAVTEPRGPLLVLLTLRADFFYRAMQYSAFYRLLDAHHVSVLPMERDDLRRVIEEPARLPDVQLTFEGDLVGDLLFDMHKQTGTLPLLEFTLDQLFAHRNGHMLTLHAYRKIGGVKGALAKHAETTYDALPTKEHRTLAQFLFLRLIDPGLTEQDTTRRRARLSEFELPDPAQTKLLRETMNAFVAARLLTTNEHAGVSTLEVSHEALIREWPRLAEWLREAREDVYLQQKISEDALEWQQRHHPKDRLYRGSQLKEARAWGRRSTPSQLERTFLHASVKQRVRLVLSMIGLVLLLSATAGSTVWLFTRPPNPTLVTTLQNDGVGSLRWAINMAPPGSIITFNQNLMGRTILLTDNLIFSQKRFTIQGPGANKLTISNTTHGIQVDHASSIKISNLTLVGGESNPSTLLTNDGTLSLTNCVVSHNTIYVSSSGDFHPLGPSAGIYNDGVLTLTNTTVSGNTTAKGGSGGGIYNANETYGGFNPGFLTLIDSTVSSNAAPGGSGGGIYNQNGTIILMNSTLSDNTTAEGGGVFNAGGSLTLINSTLSGNTSNSGGGIFDSNYGGNTYDTLIFSTIYKNKAHFNGGGIFNDDGSSQDEIDNTLIAENYAPTDSDASGNFLSGGYNLIQDISGITFSYANGQQNTDLSGNQFTNLRIAPELQANNGPTQTIALLPGSPAINVIPLSACHPTANGVLITTDQRGIKRPQEAACDIGAYEYVP